MKNKFLLIVSVALALCAVQKTNAQTSSTAAASTNSTTGFWDNVALGAKDLGNDILALKPFTTNGSATVRIGVGMNTAERKEVTAVMITLPVSEHVGIGIVTANIGSKFYEGGANLTLGATNDVPVIGTVEFVAGDGIVYDFANRNPANYSFTGVEKNWRISSKFELDAGVIVANTSDHSGVDILLGVGLTYWWGAITNPN